MMIKSPYFGIVAFVTLAVCVAAHAEVLVSDTFTNGSQYGTQMTHLGAPGSPAAGLSPDGTNLPGGTWQAIARDDYDNRVFTNAATPLAGQTHWASGRNGNGAAIPITSSGSYVRPNALRIAATLSPYAGNNPSAGGTEYLGFYSVITDTDTQYTFGAAAHLVGLALNDQGDLNLIVNGVTNPAATGFTTIAAGTSIFDANGLTTLQFDIDFNPATYVATISNIVLGGVTHAGSYTTAALDEHAIDLAGFAGTNSGFATGGMLTSFTVSTVPEPATATLLAVGGLLITTRRRN